MYLHLFFIQTDFQNYFKKNLQSFKTLLLINFYRISSSPVLIEKLLSWGRLQAWQNAQNGSLFID